jgi:hypothetical protein
MAKLVKKPFLHLFPWYEHVEHPGATTLQLIATLAWSSPLSMLWRVSTRPEMRDLRGHARSYQGAYIMIIMLSLSVNKAESVFPQQKKFSSAKAFQWDPGTT